MSRPSARWREVDRARTETCKAERLAILEWIERQGIESIKSRFVTADVIAKEAQTTLTVLLAAVGGSAAYAARLFEPGPAEPLVVAAAATCGYLAALAAILVLSCMMFRSYPAQFQEPNNLLIDDASLEQLREAELQNLDERIKEATQLNATRARHLNQIRLAAVFSVVVFVAVGAVAPKRMAASKPSLVIECAPDAAQSASSATLRCRVGS